MSKAVLLASASVIIFSVDAHAKPNLNPYMHTESHVETRTSSILNKEMLVNPVLDNKMNKENKIEEDKIDVPTQALSQESVDQKLSPEVIVDFARFSYSVDKKAGWTKDDKAIYNKLINDGWILDAFNGTTGSANSQVESVSGLLAFKDDHIVIATRGTEMANWNDWMTNFRFSRSPITRFFANDEQNKLGAITAQFFGGVDGEVANGFLQTHLSSWDYIKEAILSRAQSLGKSTKDLHYTITGHSKGAAKAQLNALNLLTDSTLAIGVDYLEKSFIGSDSTMEDLGMSGFYGMGIKSEPQNQGNVDTVVFESPRLFSYTTAERVDAIVGKDNLIRIENRSDGIMGIVDTDPVTHLTPEVIYNHVGTTVEIDGGGTFITRHMMGNVGEAAIPAIKEHRANVSRKVILTDTNSVSDSTAKAVISQTQETESTYFGKTVVDAFMGAGSAITSSVSSAIDRCTSAVKNAWSYLWG